MADFKLEGIFKQSIVVLRDGDNTTWTEDASVIDMSEALAQAVEDDATILRRLVRKQHYLDLELESRVFHVSDIFDCLQTILEIAENAKGKNINTKISALENIHQILIDTERDARTTRG